MHNGAGTGVRKRGLQEMARDRYNVEVDIPLDVCNSMEPGIPAAGGDCAAGRN